MIFLDRNENHFGPAPECFEVLRSTTNAALTSYSRDFLRGVKSALSETIASHYHFPETHLLLSYGSEDMLKQLVHCYLSPGQTMLVPNVSWWYYKSVAAEVGGIVYEYPLVRTQNRYSYSIDALVSLIKNRQPSLVLIASPNNPTGNSMENGALVALLNECRDTKIILDEAYFGFSDKAEDVVPSFVRQYPNLAILRTFSKLYGLAGLRIGYAFVGSDYTKMIGFSSRYLGYNTISESCALAAIRNTEYYHSVRSSIIRERQRYYDFFEQVPGYTAFHSDANFVLVEFPPGETRRCSRHLSESGIAIKLFTENELSDHARITIGRPEHNSLVIDSIKLFNELPLIARSERI